MPFPNHRHVVASELAFVTRLFASPSVAGARAEGCDSSSEEPEKEGTKSQSLHPYQSSLQVTTCQESMSILCGVEERGQGISRHFDLGVDRCPSVCRRHDTTEMFELWELVRRVKIEG